MKRILIYLTLMAATIAIPTERTDLGKLKPVETVSLYVEKGEVVLSTDTEDSGRGSTVEEALQNMKDTASGIIYLDTADFLLVRKGAESWISEMRGVLEDSAEICYAESAVDITTVASYLSVHKPDMKLEEWTAGAKMLMLCMQGEHMRLR